MGQLLARIWNWFFGKKERRILMIGLGGSGKTTILYKLKLGEAVNTIPTIGFNVENVEYKGFKLTMWDVGGQDKIRSLWVHYFADSNDREKIEEAKQEIQKLLSEEELKNVGFLFLANKQDLPNAMTVAEIVDKLQLFEIKSRQWFLQATCAITGDGLYEGLDWLIKKVKN